MKSAALSGNRALSQVAERQMRQWAMQLEMQKHLAEEEVAPAVPQLIKPFIAISRDTGAQGEELARRVAERLGWKVFGRELLDYMADQYHLSRISLDFVDEKAASLFHEMFGKWLDKQLVSQAEYVSRLGNIILLAAQHESIVFVGRGAQFILPRESGVAFRVIAPKKQRIESIMQRRQCDRNDAEKFIDDTDAGRAEFIRRYFQRETADSNLYDLVLNLKYLSLDEAVEVMANHCRNRFPSIGAAQPIVRPR
jgi:cytidylate kinase